MKSKNTKRAHDSFSKRSTHKRKGKEKARAELSRMLEGMSVGTDALHVRTTQDRGRAGRIRPDAKRDEKTAEGIFSSSRSGFGFVETEASERDIFIPEGSTLGAIDGDRVEIIYRSYTNRFGEEKTEGRVVKILEYGRKTVIGTLEYDRHFYSRKKIYKRLVVIPDDAKVSISPAVKDDGGARIGDKVEAVLIRSGTPVPECRVVRSFGEAGSKDANYAAILAEEGIEVDFTGEELAEAEFFAAMPLSDEGRVRRDREIIFTIDGEGAKDLDDAVSLRRLKGGAWQLGVHIADVSYYVRERTHLDRAVMKRATSVYFTDKVVPMLPPSLSNGACSLNPGEDKYTLSAVISLSPRGEITAVRLEPSIIRSRVRGVYSEVNKIFDGTADADIKKKYSDVIPTLRRMHELYLILAEKSAARGALELDSPEAELVLGEDGMPIDIIKRTRGDAERMIEQFMLAANEAVATLLTQKGIPCVYRIHELPSPERISDFLEFARGLGLSTLGISHEAPSPCDLSRLLSEAEEKGISEPVSYLLLRSLSKAKYSENKCLHFGLGIELYCHFTSPIRRLSDLATHRIIHRVLIDGKRAEIYSGYARRAAAAATEGELRAVSAERRIENLYKVLYMQQFVGDEFDARISSLTSFGIFAALPNTCEGLIPMSELPGLPVFDEKNITVRASGHIFRLADPIRVRLVGADILTGKLRFDIVI